MFDMTAATQGDEMVITIVIERDGADGEWTAWRLGGHVGASGGTPEQAIMRAKAIELRRIAADLEMGIGNVFVGRIRFVEQRADGSRVY